MPAQLWIDYSWFPLPFSITGLLSTYIILSIYFSCVLKLYQRLSYARLNFIECTFVLDALSWIVIVLAHYHFRELFHWKFQMECIISGENMLHVFEYTLKIPLPLPRFDEPVAPCSPRGGGRIDNISIFQCQKNVVLCYYCLYYLSFVLLYCLYYCIVCITVLLVLLYCLYYCIVCTTVLLVLLYCLYYCNAWHLWV